MRTTNLFDIAGSLIQCEAHHAVLLNAMKTSIFDMGH